MGGVSIPPPVGMGQSLGSQLSVFWCVYIQPHVETKQHAWNRGGEKQGAFLLLGFSTKYRGEYVQMIEIFFFLNKQKRMGVEGGWGGDCRPIAGR